MRKETIVYTDYNGEDRKEDFFFNLNKAEVLQMEMRAEGGMEAYITQIINTRDRNKIADLFQTIIDKSYGVKTLDGGFVKRPEDLERFKATEAYSELYIKLASDADAAAEFIAGVMPRPEDPNKSKDRNVLAVEDYKRQAQERLNKVMENENATGDNQPG